MIKCLECGIEKLSIVKHFKNNCSISLQEYKQKYLNAELISETIRFKSAKKGELNGRYKGNYKYCECGQQIRNVSINCKNCTYKNRAGTFAGKFHSDETKKQMKLSAAKRDKTTIFKLPTPDPLKISEIQKKHWAKFSYEERILKLSKWIEAGRKNGQKYSKTKIENKVFEFLESLNLQFIKRNITIKRFNVDFFINKTYIIECHGDYWHCNPEIYKNDFYNKSLRCTSKEKWVKDEHRLNLLKKDFKVLVIWEAEIHKDFENVKLKIQNFLN